MRKKYYNSSVLRLILALKMMNFRNPELELSDQQIPGTHKFRTNIFRPTKFRTNKLPNQLISGFFAILTDLFWSGVWCFTVPRIFSTFNLQLYKYKLSETVRQLSEAK